MGARRIKQRTIEEASREIAEVDQWLAAQGEDAVRDLIPLTDDDFHLVGVFIQMFAFADFNGRRILEVIDDATGTPATPINKTLRDNEVLSAAAKWLGEIDIDEASKATIQAACGAIDGMSLHRHHFAHWAGRRAPNTDALVLMTKNSREASRRVGKPLDDYEFQYVVVPVPELKSALITLQINVSVLAQATAQLWEHFHGGK